MWVSMYITNSYSYIVVYSVGRRNVFSDQNKVTSLPKTTNQKLKFDPLSDISNKIHTDTTITKQSKQ